MIRKFSRGNVKELVNNLDVAIDPYFTEEELNRLARETNFSKRESKLKGSIFLYLIVFNSENLKNQSLNDLAVMLGSNYKVDISKQGLDQRFNENSILFLKEALEKVLDNQLKVEFSFTTIKGIQRILIKDSVCFQIDNSLSEYYPGSGGSGSKASVRIQFEYDILNGKINDFSLNAFNAQDAKDSLATIELLKEGDLVIRDLAYMSLGALKSIIKKAAFYLCRLGPKLKVYEKKRSSLKELDFRKIYCYMKKNNISMIEKEVYIGQEEKLKTRLIIHMLPGEEVEKRLRKARLNNIKKGRKALSKEYIARAHLNLFISNADAKQIPPENVWSLYRLRWQIELVFKVWKSICHIEKVKKVKKHRLECYIYSKLIFIALGWQIVWSTAQRLFTEENKALSYYKAFKTLLNTQIYKIRTIFLKGEASINDFINQFYCISKKFHLLERKNANPTSLEILINCSTH